MDILNEASTTDSITKLSHALCAIADTKILSSILYSSGNTQVKICWGPYIKWAKISVSRGLNRSHMK